MAKQDNKKSSKTRKIVWISLSILLVASLTFASVAFADGGKRGKFKRGGFFMNAPFFDKGTVVEKFDDDKDGNISKDEFVEGMLELHKAHVEIMFSYVDRDENGVLSAEEMKQWVSSRDRKGRKGRKGRRYHDDDHHDDDDHHYDDDDDDDDDHHYRKRRRR